jgi:photosystem I subunit PsaN
VLFVLCHVLPQVEDLLAKSTTNKALNDKKRLATSSANLARSRCA